MTLGIEYGDMQLISEAYTILKSVGECSNDELSKIFADWNKGELDSFLIEITSKILAKKDVDVYTNETPAKLLEGTDKSKSLVDVVLDKTGNKGKFEIFHIKEKRFCIKKLTTAGYIIIQERVR